MSEVFIPTTNQIRAGINALEMNDEVVAREPILASLHELAAEEVRLVLLEIGTEAGSFGAGFLLGLATARQQ